jgi:nitrate/nitrite transporter NarK
VRLDKKFQERHSSDDELDSALDETDISLPTSKRGSPQAAVLSFKQLDLPLNFWLVCFIMCLYYGADIPFNAIHSSFLESKWYKGDPKTASQIMAIPDTISALLIPFVGTFVDRFGHRCKVMIVCGLIMMTCHTYFAFAIASDPSPIFALISLGLAYAMLLTFWPCIPLIVKEGTLSTALYVPCLPF